MHSYPQDLHWYTSFLVHQNLWSITFIYFCVPNLNLNQIPQEATARKNILNLWPVVGTMPTPRVEAARQQDWLRGNWEPERRVISSIKVSRQLRAHLMPYFFPLPLMFFFLGASWCLFSYLLNVKIIILLQILIYLNALKGSVLIKF